MSKLEDTQAFVGTSDRSDRRFKVGDLVILNDCERPCALLVAVIVGDDGELYSWRYLSAAPELAKFRGMRSRLSQATLVADFGAQIRVDILAGIYWCVVVKESVAKYSDGAMRHWQEYSGPVRCTMQAELAEYFGTIGHWPE